MAEIIYGIYEQIVNNVINESLAQLDNDLVETKIAKLDPAESTKILSNYLRRIMLEIFSYIEGDDSVGNRINICNSILKHILEKIKSGSYGFKRNQDVEKHISNYFVKQDAGMLLSLIDKKSLKMTTKTNLIGIRPESSIADNSLFTGATHEPSMVSELQKEILTSDRIDFIVSFVKWSGLRLMINQLREFTDNGGRLRLISTSYMGATDFKAIDQLSKLKNTEIRISFDTKRTRLHAKTYVFWRNTGFSTAYIGSSNISESAITSGLEWNIKLSEYDSKDVLEKVKATFESYWNNPEFEFYHQELSRARLKEALQSERFSSQKESEKFQFHFDIRPYFYQQEILDKLKAARKVHGHYRNLVVAATGTGKTLISAFDYRDFCRENSESKNRILFVAHRKEILVQSLNCFRGVLKDLNFGSLLVGNEKADNYEHLFVSIQSFNSKALIQETSPDFYDFIVIDEIHHGAAPSYHELLKYYRPKVLLGLTATPERADGRDVLRYFDGGITTELRLYEAIERKLLSPFHYFGITDSVDLRQVKWTNGRYDESELENLFVLDEKVSKIRAGYVLQGLSNYGLESHKIVGLGFCVSKKHAEYMAKIFNEDGIPSEYLTADSTSENRNGVKHRLVKGELRFIFVVDLYNEGVDIPEVNTVLFLRPTESLTVFLQQLGRGLRLSDGKEALTVLDFVGQANNKFAFEDRFRAMMAKTRNTVEEEINKGFVNVPRGCSIQLERVAQQHILENIKSAINNRKNIMKKLRDLYARAGKIDAFEFFQDYNIKPYEVYGKKSTLINMAYEAGILREADSRDSRDSRDSKSDTVLMGSTILNVASIFLRLSTLNSSQLLKYMMRILPEIRQTHGDNVRNHSEKERKLLIMCYYTFFNLPLLEKFERVESAIYSVLKDEMLFEECMSLIRYQYEQIDFVSEQIDELGSDSPLDLHCSYSRDLILAALGKSNENYKYPSREGTLNIREENLDVFFVTLNKSEKEYSPTTMYQDYIINEELFHWQSQSTTSVESKTGLRYINQKDARNRVLLFVREFTKDASGTSPYVCLGLVEYEEHSGSLPISIKYRLKKAIPGKLLENCMIV